VVARNVISPNVASDSILIFDYTYARPSEGPAGGFGRAVQVIRPSMYRGVARLCADPVGGVACWAPRRRSGWGGRLGADPVGGVDVGTRTRYEKR